jgi:hypothetical protein
MRALATLYFVWYLPSFLLVASIFYSKKNVLCWKTLVVAGGECREGDENPRDGFCVYEIGTAVSHEGSESSKRRKEAVAKAKGLAKLKAKYTKSKGRADSLIREQATARQQLHRTKEEMKRVGTSSGDEGEEDEAGADGIVTGDGDREIGQGKMLEELEEELGRTEQLLDEKTKESTVAQREMGARKEEWKQAQREQDGRFKAESARKEQERQRLQAKEAQRQNVLLLFGVVSVQTKWRAILAHKVISRRKELRLTQGKLVVCAQCGFRRWSARRRYLRVRGWISRLQRWYRMRRLAGRVASASVIGRACLCAHARDLVKMKRRVRKRFHKLWPLIRLLGNSAHARRKRIAATAIQALCRGRARRKLCTLLTTVGCALSAEIHCAEGIRDANFVVEQDPYVIVTLVPRQRPFTLRSVRRSVIDVNGGFRDAAIEAVAKAVKKQEAGGSDACSERTGCAYGGGVEPKWTKKHNNSLVVFCDAVLPTLAAMEAVRIEV